jgi:limonene-1,2-epoxide hydrolase
MLTNQQVAEAFSRHAFREVYDVLHPQVVWTLVGEARIEGKEQVVETCEQSLTMLEHTITQFLRFKTIADAEAVAIDTLAKYVEGSNSSFVRSCDVYEFTDGYLTEITSYTAEVQPEDLP